MGLPWWLSGKESAHQCRRHKFNPWVGKIPGGGNWQPTPAFLPGKSTGHRSLYSPWGHKESNMTQQGNNDKQEGNYEHWAQERGEDWRKVIGFSLKQVKQDAGNMHALGHGRQEHHIPPPSYPSHQGPPLKRRKFPDANSAFLGQLSGKNGPHYWFPFWTPVCVSAWSTHGVVSGSLTSPYTKLYWSESGAKFRQA